MAVGPSSLPLFPPELGGGMVKNKYGPTKKKRSYTWVCPIIIISVVLGLSIMMFIAIVDMDKEKQERRKQEKITEQKCIEQCANKEDHCYPHAMCMYKCTNDWEWRADKMCGVE